MKSNLIIAAMAAAILTATSATSCNRQSRLPAPEPAAARVGDERLLLREVSAAVPAGMSPGDSTLFVHEYINRWVDRKLIEQKAEKVLPLDQIDRMVEQYRQDLLLAEYRRYCFNEQADTAFSEAELREFYEGNKALFTTDRPMVKGIYVKIASDSPRLAEVRRLLRNGSKEDINKLEGISASSAVHYDYFLDRWVDWERITALIPLQLSSNAAPAAGRTIDVSAGGFTYLLNIKELLPQGALQGYELVTDKIKEQLLNRRRMDFDESFVQRSRKQALESGEAEIF